MKKPTIKEYFDQLAEGWGERVHHDQAKIRRLFSLIEMPSEGRILDAGCGTGVLIPYFLDSLRSGLQLVALDISQAMLRRARQKFGDEGITYVHQAIEDYHSDQPFDLIVCYSCFPHFQNQPEIVRRMSGWLRLGGQLAVMHSEGRYQINRFHRETGGEVKEHFLPAGNLLACWMREAGLDEVLAVDREEFFFVSGKKLFSK